MAKFVLSGIIEGIRYTSACVVVTISESRRGYKKKDGTCVDSGIYMWCVLFPIVQKSYISNHFHRGMLVDVYGLIVPYSKSSVDGSLVDGCTIFGKTIDVGTYQSANIRMDKKIVKDSMEAMGGNVPDLDGYNEEDF